MRRLLDDLPQGKPEDPLFANYKQLTAVQAWLQRWCRDHGIESAFTPHDLRRTVSTRMHELGIDSFVVEKILNHKLGGVLAIYNRHDYAKQRVEAQEQWGKALSSLVSRSSNRASRKPSASRGKRAS
jgi:integrase